MWLLDTNIISAAMKRPNGPVALRLQQISAATPDLLCTSIVVACELRFGAHKVASEKLAAKIDTLLHFIRPLDLTLAVASHYARIRTELESNGERNGPNDMLIAAHALALDATLVTDNEGEFRRVVGLRVENWL
jgi:tRNA(fMet)-specific endonuclease VapC